jgi:hypothetical protein
MASVLAAEAGDGVAILQFLPGWHDACSEFQ